MKRASRPRTAAKLSKSLHQQLNMYALAAGAAGVGLLVLEQPAEAKIVYTLAHVVIGRPFPLDLNHDGIVDFYILHSASHFGGQHFLAACQIIGSYSHRVFCSDVSNTNVIRGFSRFDSALRYGAKIKKGERFTKPRDVMASFCCYSGTSASNWFGAWANGGKGVKNRYLGLKFKIKGEYHFGWARLTVTTTSHDFTALLTGYAYETIPGKAIVAGKTKGPDVTTVQPASLGHLAAGASAIPVWRMKQTAATTR
jgi:hypothetical protein